MPVSPRLFLICTLALGAAAPAGADDWSITGSVFERFEFETNRSLGADPEGHVYGGAGGLRINAERDDERTRMGLAGDIGANYFTGPGAASDGVEPDMTLSGDFAIRSRITTMGISGTASITPTSVDQQEESGETNFDANQVTAGMGLFATRQLSERASVSWNGDAVATRFVGAESGGVFTENDRFSSSIGLQRQITPEMSGSLSVSGTTVFVDATDENDTYSVNAATGVDQKFGPRFSVGGSVGATYSGLIKNRSGADGGGSATFSGSLSASYTGDAFTSAASASQSVEPTSLGELQNTTSFSVDLGYAVNDASSFSLGSTFQIQNSAVGDDGDDGDRRTFAVSPAYRYTISDTWGMRIGYDFFMEDQDAASTEISHGVFLELSQSFTLLP